jgi:hypothetical protein
MAHNNPPEYNTAPEDEHSRMNSIAHIGKRAVENLVVGIEVNPFVSETSRYALLGATYLATRDPFLAASAYAGSTALLEGSASYATADLITTEKGERSMRKISQLIDKTPLKYLIPSNKEPSIVREGLIATYLGTSIQLYTAQKAKPEITKPELRKRGMVATAYLSGLTFTEGAFGSEAIHYITDWEISAPSAVALTGILYALRRTREKFKRDTKND